MIRSLAWRSVRARKGRAFLNAAGIVLGVALFFSVLSLSKTIVSTFDELFSSVYGETDLIIAGNEGVGTVEESVLDKVRSTKGVEDTQSVVFAIMSLVKDGEVGGSQADQVFTNGVTPDSPELSGAQIVAGADTLDGNQVQLDEGWAKSNGLEPGDTAKFATPTGVHEFTVSAIFKIGKGLDFGGSGFGVINQDLARDLFDSPTGYTEIDIALEPGADLETVRAELEKILPEGVEAKTPNDVADDINAQIQGFNIILYFFAAMSLFVGGFLILNSFNMTVAQRLREIGMLRTLGASRKIVRRMILIEALLLGFIGSLFGIVVGLLLTQLMVSLVA
ncbi:MAG: ABC transporter permease, partial [Solirubrobacterales bacterium]